MSLMDFHGLIKDESIHGQELIPQKESIPWLESIPSRTDSFCKRNLFLLKVSKWAKELELRFFRNWN